MDILFLSGMNIESLTPKTVFARSMRSQSLALSSLNFEIKNYNINKTFHNTISIAHLNKFGVLNILKRLFQK